MTINENTNPGSNITGLSALTGLQSLFDSFENAGPLVGSAAAMDTSAIAAAMDTSARLGATDFPAIANAMRGVESSPSVATAAVAAMDTPSILKSVSSLNNSGLKASTALAAMDTPAFDDAVSDLGSITASINAAADLEQSIGTFGGSSALVGAATRPAFLNTLNSFESLTLPLSRESPSAIGDITSPFLVDMTVEMEELANQTEFAPFFVNDWISELALSATESLSEYPDLAGELPSQEEYTGSPVDRDFEWSLAEYTYHSFRLYLEQLEIPIKDIRPIDLYLISYVVVLHLHPSVSIVDSSRSIFDALLATRVLQIYENRSE